jgi:hypothetical protein
LKNGNCILGGDHVKVYATKIEGEAVWIDLTAVPLEDQEKKLLKNLKESYSKRQYGRMVRELVRMHFNKSDPLKGIRSAFFWSYSHFEFGMTHAYGALADWLTLYQENTGNLENQLICLVEGLDHLAFDTLRQPEFPYTEGVQEFSEEAFIQKVEEEKEKDALEILYGAFAQGQHFQDLEKLLTQVALQHYNDFGHILIWLSKAKTLISHLGNEIEKPLLASFIRSLCYSTREDLIPEFKAYAEVLQAYPLSSEASSLLDSEGLFPASLVEAFEWVLQKAQTHPPEQLFRCLLEANAKNLLYFDARYEKSVETSVSSNVGWLDFTHALTFANAVRRQCQKFPEFWKQGLLQMACFLGRNRHYLDLEQDVKCWEVFEKDIETFWESCQSQILDHGLGLPIYSAHWLKTWFAVREEYQATSDLALKRVLLSALNRFLHSPIPMKHPRRQVRQGIHLVSRDFLPRS